MVILVLSSKIQGKKWQRIAHHVNIKVNLYCLTQRAANKYLYFCKALVGWNLMSSVERHPVLATRYFIKAICTMNTYYGMVLYYHCSWAIVTEGMHQIVVQYWLFQDYHSLSFHWVRLSFSPFFVNSGKLENEKALYVHVALCGFTYLY